jgi:hypothetical protein
MPTQPLTLMSALQGTFILNNTSAWTGKADAVVVLEDTVFNVLNDDNTNDKTDYIAATGTAVKAGAIIRPLNDGQFTAVTLTSGSVALIL